MSRSGVGERMLPANAALRRVLRRGLRATLPGRPLLGTPLELPRLVALDRLSERDRAAVEATLPALGRLVRRLEEEDVA